MSKVYMKWNRPIILWNRDF